VTDAFNDVLTQLEQAFKELDQATGLSGSLQKLIDLLSSMANTISAQTEQQQVTALRDKLMQESAKLTQQREELAQQARSGVFSGVPGLSLEQAVAMAGGDGATQRPGPLELQIPPDRTKHLKDLNDALAAAGDAVAQDTIVRDIRDAVAYITPFMSDKEAAHALDDAVKAGIPEAIKAAVKKALEVILGVSAQDQPQDPSHTMPLPGAPGEQIFNSPQFKFDRGPDRHQRTSFDITGAKSTYKAGEEILFRVAPPDDFDTIAGNKRVVIVAAADRGQVNPDRLANVMITSKESQTVTMTAPAQTGSYVLRVDIGMSFDDSSMVDFTVAP
jgi:hypothetical protein